MVAISFDCICGLYEDVYIKDNMYNTGACVVFADRFIWSIHITTHGHRIGNS